MHPILAGVGHVALGGVVGGAVTIGGLIVGLFIASGVRRSRGSPEMFPLYMMLVALGGAAGGITATIGVLSGAGWLASGWTITSAAVAGGFACLLGSMA